MRASLLTLILLVTFGCSDEEAPTVPSKSADLEAQKDLNSSDQTARSAWGADIGTEDVKKRLAECNERGYFFDRTGDDGNGSCDEERRIADFRCTDFDSVADGANLNDFQREKLTGVLSGDLEGYAFDQCLDESDTQYAAYLVKEVEDGSIKVSRMTIEKP